MNIRHPIRAAILPLLLILSLLSGCTRVSADRPADDPQLKIVIPNTGKSDCCVIFTPDATLMIDCADRDDYETIRQILSDGGREQIDLLILTHYDNDHVGSAGELVRNFAVTRVVGPDYVRNSLSMVALSENLTAVGGHLEKLTDDLRLSYGELAVSISTPKGTNYSDENDYSLITTLEYGECDFLFLGDACNARLKEFCRESGRYDFVKLPHHGDYEGAMSSLFMTCGFRYAVLCEDKAEDSRLTDLLKSYSIQTYRTYNGGVRIVSDGQSVEVTQ